jgi:Spy/CpxP family protein refolding chaperone
MNTKSLLQLCGAAMVALLPLSTVSAQSAKASPDDKVAKMKADLSLSDDQVAKLKEIYAEQKAAADPIMQDKSLTKEQRQEKLKPIKEATKTKVNAVLTPEQHAKMKAAKKEKKDKKDS